MKHLILIVDPDPKAVLTIEYYIRMTRDDVKIFVTATAEQAFEVYSKEQVDLVITEINLPDGNGRNMVLEMREKNPTLPVIIQTAERDNEFIKETWRLLRIVDYFEKPFAMEIFTDALNYALDKPRKAAVKFIVAHNNEKSFVEINLDTFLGGETIKEEDKLILYSYQFKTGKVIETQLNKMTIKNFLSIAARHTNAIVQCQKSYFLNKNRIVGFDGNVEPPEFIMEYGDVRFPAGGKVFMKNFDNMFK